MESKEAIKNNEDVFSDALIQNPNNSTAMLTPGDIEEKLRQVKPLLKEKFFVEQLGYFGSFAAGTQTGDSDVDILVAFSKPLGWEFFDLKSALEKELQRKVDLVSIKALKTQLREIILKQAIFV